MQSRYSWLTKSLWKSALTELGFISDRQRLYLYLVRLHEWPCQTTHQSLFPELLEIGSVGRGVIKLIREHNIQVRALVHRLDERSEVLSEMGAEIVITDLTNGADMVRALRGYKRMFFGMRISPPYLQTTAIATGRAKEIADFEILVNISQMTVSQMSLTEMTQSIRRKQHWLGERLNWSGVPVSHVSLTIFLEPLFSRMAS